MAGAPRKQGLDYFPMPTSFDSVYNAIRQNFKAQGVEIYLELYKSIYGDRGYYIIWDEKKAKIFSLENDFPFKKVMAIINDMLNQDFFDQNLFKSYKILTNLSIQQAFFHAIKRRKVIEYEPKYLLLNVEKYLEIEIDKDELTVDKQQISQENDPINVDINVNMNANMNVDNDVSNHVNKTQTKERIVKDSKVEETKAKEIFKENADFEKSDSEKNNFEVKNPGKKEFLTLSNDLKVADSEEINFESNPKLEQSPPNSAQSPPLKELAIKPDLEPPQKLYPRVLEAYSDFVKHIIGLPMKKLTGREGNATKEIIDYLKKIDPSDDGVVEVWIGVLNRWRDLEPFFQNQFKLVQINSNLQMILNNLGLSVNRSLSNQINGKGHKKNGAKPVYGEVQQAFESYRRNR